MADRLAALGGWLEVLSAPGQGTTITGYLPVSPATSDPERRTVMQVPVATEASVDRPPAFR
jgi:signal transduction histidine kinase